MAQNRAAFLSLRVPRLGEPIRSRAPSLRTFRPLLPRHPSAVVQTDCGGCSFSTAQDPKQYRGRTLSASSRLATDVKDDARWQDVEDNQVVLYR